MPTVIEKACKGSSGAMRSLYDDNKRESMFLCRALLGSDEEAAEALPKIFKRMWEELLSGQVQSQEEFHDVLVRRTANYCRAQVTGKNPKAFRMPSNQNFSDPSYSMELGDGRCEEALKELPPLYRFLYVLSGVCGCDEGKLAKWFRIKKERVRLILEAEEMSLERTGTGRLTKEGFHEALRKERDRTRVPEETEQEILQVMEEICRPIRERLRKKKRRIWAACGAAAAAVCLIVILVFAFRGGSGTDTAAETTAAETTAAGTEETDAAGDTEAAESEAVSQVEADYYADIQIQDYGTVTVALDAEAAPETVSNFVSLAQSGFYDGLTFHRIIEGFMMQGGDPNGDGTGGSDTTIKGEFSDNGVENSLSHTRGAISMARSSDYDSASSQFFIVQEDSTYLDGQYAVFGYVTEGMDVVDAVCEAAEPVDDNGTISQEAQPVITSITIRDGEGA